MIYLPPFAITIYTLAVYILAIKIFNYIFAHFLKKLVNKTNTKVDDRLLDVFHDYLFLIMLLFAVYFAIKPLAIPDQTMTIIIRVLSSLGILVVGFAATAVLRILFHAFQNKLDPHKETWADILPFADGAIKIILLATAVMIMLDMWNVNIAPLLASAGIIGVAVAFAAKDTVANLFGGLSVFFDKPYKTGDYVIIDDKYRGEVITIGMRSTKIKTRDSVLLTVPNSVMITNAVINETGFDPRLRIRIPISLAVNTNLENAEKVLIDVMKKHSDVAKDYTPRVRFRKFGDYTVDLELLCMIEKPALRGRVIHELIKSIKKTLEAEKISMPYPQRDVHLYKNDK